ncbi:VOC family protein [Aestuariicella hydrocarbonica]|uniref:VOC family protein n=1 Tax=Pseudomaricurvus hydrocarbonicus TaxID=1470433 RepID=A0A9E5JUN8_9GAMM|nr:VOC family protein [Aestuariicella hydrocarbonica]NHO65791.1 VOC family protein [Aestuariicella hydrocarbonica]
MDFLELNKSSYLAFVYTPKNSKQVDIGITHSGNPIAECTMGTMQHLAFNVDTLEDLLALRDRIRANNIHCMGPLDHGFAKSIYFAGPEGLTLEVCTLTGSDINNWVDPEVVSLLGISDDELEKLRNPEPFNLPTRPVSQPSLQGASPLKMVFPEQAYNTIMSSSDEAVEAMFKETWEPEP